MQFVCVVGVEGVLEMCVSKYSDGIECVGIEIFQLKFLIKLS